MEIVLITIVLIYAISTTLLLAYLILGDHSINIVYKQQFSEEDRKLLEDLYNEDGEFKNKNMDMLETLDGAIREINSIMTGVEEESDG